MMNGGWIMAKKKERLKSDRLLRLDFDQYTRNFLITNFIEGVREGDKKFKVLDVGGRNGRFCDFLPNDEIYILDIRGSEANEKNFYVGSILNPPFSSERFDIVLSTDVLEHIGSEDREKALSNMLNLAGRYLILSAPFDTPNVSATEKMASSFRREHIGKSDPWLLEHFKMTLPKIEQLEMFFEEKKLAYFKVGSNNLHLWLMMRYLLSFVPAYSDSWESVKAISKFYDSNMKELGDGLEPTYRKIYFAAVGDNPLPRIMNGEKFDPEKLNSLTTKIFETFGRETKKFKLRSEKQKYEFESLARKSTSLEKEVELLNQELNEILNSTSWKLAEKIRKASKAALSKGLSRSVKSLVRRLIR